MTELTHYGVKGMKWGVRKEKESRSERRARREENALYNYERKYAHHIDAKERAQRTVKRDKIIKAAVGTAVAAGIAYAGYRAYNQWSSDVTIGGSKKLFSMNDISKMDTKRGFYANEKGSWDERMYRNMFKDHLRKNGKAEIYGHTISSKESIKIAGHKSAKKVYKNLVNEKYPEFKNTSYTSFNNNYPLYKSSGSKIVDDYHKALKNSGYSGFKDSNDAFFSGFNAKNPMIITDGNKLKVSNVEDLTYKRDSLGDGIFALRSTYLPATAAGGVYMYRKNNMYKRKKTPKY